jgi:hypothetical protein
MRFDIYEGVNGRTLRIGLESAVTNGSLLPLSTAEGRGAERRRDGSRSLKWSRLDVNDPSRWQEFRKAPRTMRQLKSCSKALRQVIDIVVQFTAAENRRPFDGVASRHIDGTDGYAR